MMASSFCPEAGSGKNNSGELKYSLIGRCETKVKGYLYDSRILQITICNVEKIPNLPCV